VDSDRISADRRRWEAKYTAGGSHARCPTPYLNEALAFIPHRGVALDLGMGEGENAQALAQAGFRVVGLDLAPTAVRRARDGFRAAGLTGCMVEADALSFPFKPGSFDCIICFRFLERSLAPALTASLRPGGCLVFETFTVGQMAHSWGPRNPDYLLGLGELPRLFSPLEVLSYQEVDDAASGALARLVARRPGPRP
jgi:tellurite methyltransferase